MLSTGCGQHSSQAPRQCMSSLPFAFPVCAQGFLGKCLERERQGETQGRKRGSGCGLSVSKGCPGALQSSVVTSSKGCREACSQAGASAELQENVCPPRGMSSSWLGSNQPCLPTQPSAPEKLQSKSRARKRCFCSNPVKTGVTPSTVPGHQGVSSTTWTIRARV